MPTNVGRPSTAAELNVEWDAMEERDNGINSETTVSSDATNILSGAEVKAQSEYILGF